MKPLPHHYDVHLTGGPTGYAQTRSAGLPDLRTAAPVEFGGPGDAWSPEHLLLASVVGCFLLTIRAVARPSNVDFITLDVDAAGTVDRRDGVTRFTNIVLRPHLTVPAGTIVERVRRVIEKTEKTCLVTASLSVPVRIEPTIHEAGETVPQRPAA